METAIRWSPHSTPSRPYFIILDVVKSRLELCEATFSKPQSTGESPTVEWKVLRNRDRLPTYTAFDFSKVDPFIIGLGGDVGEATIINLQPDQNESSRHNVSFGVKSQRKCNTIAFSSCNYVATGLDRVSRDQGLYVFDLDSSGASPGAAARPVRTLANSEGITSIKFFGRENKTLLAGVHRQSIRLYDLRDSAPTSALQFPTRLVHNLAIDPLDENYFVSAGPEKEPLVGVWDKRMLKASTTPGENGPPGSILEIRSAIDGAHHSSIFSLRFCGLKRGTFSVLSGSGEVRVFELAQHRGDLDKDAMPHNPNGGTPWISKTYTRRTHTLAYPYWHQNAPKQDKERVTACDFVTVPGLTRNLSMLSLHKNRTIKVLEVHTVPRAVNITAMDELYLWKNRQTGFKPEPDADTIAEDLILLQNKANLAGDQKAFDQSLFNTSVFANLSLAGLGTKSSSFDSPLSISSSDRHEELLMLNFPQYIPEITDSLKLLQTHRRRCEEGYSLDVARNQRIVANDPWLDDMWDAVSKLEELSKKGEMVVDGLDLSYLGVYALWTGDFSKRNRLEEETNVYDPRDIEEIIKTISRRKGHPSFQGHDTKRPYTRQLCLALCRWTFSKQILRSRCQRLMDQGQHYKAIVSAVMRGFSDLAQDVLKSSIQKRAISNIGLGAVIACGEVVTESQRSMCAWMAEETDDPYLKALLAYFISGDWHVVCDMPILPLYDRLGCAIKYLDDARLDAFIRLLTAGSVVSGNIEGLVLTGLTEKAVDLFSRSIAKHGDVQTAVLALSFAAPVYLADARFEAWRDTYLLQMQTWRAFHQRAIYIAEHTKRSSTKVRLGDKQQRFGDTPSRPISLRCPQCLGALASHSLSKGPPPPTQITSPEGTLVPTTTATTPIVESVTTLDFSFQRRAAAHSGIVCPRCGRAQPHCGICGLLLGMPDPEAVRRSAVTNLHHNHGSASTAAGAPASNHASSESRPPTAMDRLNAMSGLGEQDPLSGQALYCMRCLHVFHGHHAREWFARQRVCPVPECECMCGILH
jgi:hypothetical protein